MDYEVLDRILLAQNVAFLPWIGKKYDEGFHGRRLLILGESHYDEWNGEKHVLGNSFTRECILKIIAREHGAVFWPRLEQALLCEMRFKGWAPNGGRPLWDKLAFYNFIQSPISGGPRVRPSSKVFQESQKRFRLVLEQLRPERVLVCGKGLWNGMEPVTLGEDIYHRDVKSYRFVDGTKVCCLATVHPSSGSYSWSRLHRIIMGFVKDPSDAIALL
ncbi:hypothetical protein [Methylocella silvestris]|uniref:hypothetical protein n=1 Tax=Methylocella silvestris TaxID=199596 RepID=UPI0011AF6C43|nr:hypothetical protein [Methylocella silvestris]